MARSQPISTFTILFYLLAIPSHCSIEAGQQKQQQPIKNIVVLVLENRSFDHMLGWMKQSLNLSINGLTGSECNPSSTHDPKSPPVCVSSDAQFVDPDPGHSFDEVYQQVFGSGKVPSMSGFVQQALSISQILSDTVMKGFKPENLPVFTALVREFSAFDRWFSSVPGPTQPNRLFVYSATSRGSVGNDKLGLFQGYPQKTIFDSLVEDGLDFGVYFKNIPTTFFYRNLRKPRYISKFHWFETFKEHAKQGRLRNLSVIEPRYFDLVGSGADDDHPSHDVANGQKLVKEVYEALRSSPQWNESLLIITYDEHGGFYDHVKTPYVGVPSPDGNKGPGPFFFGFDRLGVRVPTIMVSPWIKKGTGKLLFGLMVENMRHLWCGVVCEVVSTARLDSSVVDAVVSRPNGPSMTSEFEHSSIPASIKKIFNLRSPFLTKRDAWAGTFEHLFSQLDTPRTNCPEVLPDVVPLRGSDTNEDKLLSEFQRELVDLARALNGDFPLNSLRDESGKQMTVKEADQYVTRATSMFIQASKAAIDSGADQSAIVDMRKSLKSTEIKSP